MSKPRWRADGGQAPASRLDLSDSLRTAVRSLIAYLLRSSPREADVEDCVNETFRRALEGRARLTADQPTRPWVLGIARHVALDALRERRRAARLVVVSEEDDTHSSSNQLLERLAGDAPTAEDRAVLTQRVEVLARTLDTLPAEQRRALLMFHVEGCSYREIADDLGVPPGTVGTWLTRGRQVLATALRETNS